MELLLFTSLSPSVCVCLSVCDYVYMYVREKKREGGSYYNIKKREQILAPLFGSLGRQWNRECPPILVVRKLFAYLFKCACLLEAAPLQTRPDIH